MAHARAWAFAALGLVLMALPAAAADKLDTLILKRDYAAAIGLLKKRAAAGDPEAEYRLGGMYRIGLGVKPDRSKALSFLKAASDHGNAKARLALQRLNATEAPGTDLNVRPWTKAVAPLPSVRAGAPDAAGNPWLVAAASRDLLKALPPASLNSAARLHSRDGGDALAAAIRGNRPAAAAQLLAAGVETASPAESHGMHLALAAAHASPAIIDLLTAAGARPGPALRQAAARCNLVNTQALIKAGIEWPEGASRTPLIDAVLACADNDVVQTLAEISPVDARDLFGRTALWYAAATGAESHVALLLAHGATLAAADEEGLTPLHAAAAWARADALSVLLAQGSDAAALTRNGDTPLMLAAAAGCAPCIARLPASSGLLDARNARGETALLLAVSANAPDAVALLLKRGADASLRDARRETAVSVAQRLGNAKVVSLLGVQ